MDFFQNMYTIFAGIKHRWQTKLQNLFFFAKFGNFLVNPGGDNFVKIVPTFGDIFWDFLCFLLKNPRVLGKFEKILSISYILREKIFF